MATKRVKQCKECGKTFSVDDLSGQGLCYRCAKKNMIKAFDTMWSLSRKRGGPGWSEQTKRALSRKETGNAR